LKFGIRNLALSHTGFERSPGAIQVAGNEHN
jgi:hypothetical protein